MYLQNVSVYLVVNMKRGIHGNYCSFLNLNAHTTSHCSMFSGLLSDKPVQLNKVHTFMESFPISIKQKFLTSNLLICKSTY